MIRSVRIGFRDVEYTLICAQNRSTLLLQALPEDKIRLYAPTGTRLRDADQFVCAHIHELDEAHSRLREALHSENTGLPSSLSLEGHRVPVKIINSERRLVIFRNDGITVKTDLDSEAEIREQLKHALSELALKRLTENLRKWSPSIPIPYRRVTVREQKTRWGSCSSKHNLNFNWKLIMAPPQALEYVVIHELCHLIHFNHSALFWKEVEARMPDYEIWKKWLKQNGSQLNLS